VTWSGFPPADAHRRGVVVLVHGAWVGEWCWAPVLDELERSGRRAIAVSLSGHGVRRRESSPSITLSDHVADLREVLEVHDLLDAIVVGHSYGGRVITKAWPDIAARTARMVYVDAHAPLGPPVAPLVGEPGGMIPFAGFDPDPDLIGGDDGVRWFLERVMPLSGATQFEDFRVELPTGLSKAYIAATGYDNIRFGGYAADARERPDWEYHELSGDHWLMFSHPVELARIICGDLSPEGRSEPS